MSGLGLSALVSWVLIPTLSVSSCVTSGKFVNVTRPRFPHW
jgi:hypothetical protein